MQENRGKVQKPMEERGENGRRHASKKMLEDVMENTMKLQENMIMIRGNRAKSLGKWRKPSER